MIADAKKILKMFQGYNGSDAHLEKLEGVVKDAEKLYNQRGIISFYETKHSSIFLKVKEVILLREKLWDLEKVIISYYGLLLEKTVNTSKSSDDDQWQDLISTSKSTYEVGKKEISVLIDAYTSLVRNHALEFCALAEEISSRAESDDEKDQKESEGDSIG